MKICLQCGETLNEGAAQCAACGAAVPATDEHSTTSGEGETRLLEKTGAHAGRVLSGRYRLDSLIASGGMGEVYRAQRLHIGDTVAVKVLRPEVVDNPTTRERFQREARAAARLRHPNAVVIHDFGEDTAEAQSIVYIVMELLDGRSLRQVLDEDGPMEAVRAYPLVRQACAVLAEGHRQGIIHRDLKPDNIMLTRTPDGEDYAKLLDFGIAKLRENRGETGTFDHALTKLGTFLGTPYYMSPEQCQGEPVDARSDVYSLGVVLYELLTGMVPFTAKTATGVAIKHVTEEPPPPSKYKPELNPEIEQLILRALAKEPEARQQSVLEVAREYEAALASRAEQTTRDLTIEPRTELMNKAEAEQLATQMLAGADTREQQRQTAPQPNYETVIGPAPSAVRQAAELRTTEPMPSASKAAVAEVATPPLRRKLLIAGLAAVLLVSTALALWRANTEREVRRAADATPTPFVAAQNAPTPTPINNLDGMVFIAGGALLMGRDDGEENERPLHSVTVKPFYLDRTEVTNEHYKFYLDANKQPAPPDWQDGQTPEGAEKWPVTGVSWEEAANFAAWARKRLPTEEEWEFAARGATDNLYPWGREWCAECANVANAGKNVQPVGQFPQGASSFGALDLSGNAAEWTASDYKAYPNGKIAPPRSGQTRLKVVRGGSFASTPVQATATARQGVSATVRDWGASQASYRGVGFRCVRDP